MSDITNNLKGDKFSFGTPSQKNGVVIQFYHIPTIKNSVEKSIENGSQATFRAFLNTFKDNFRLNWNQKETYGRMDPIQSFKNTQRTLNIDFDVPSYDEFDARDNFIELQKLISMQYPVYETIKYQDFTPQQSVFSGQSGDGAIDIVAASGATTEEENALADLGAAGGTVLESETEAYLAEQTEKSILSNAARGAVAGKFISAPPLIYVKFFNWISNEQVADKSGFLDCLVAAINEVSFEPDLEQGIHFINGVMIPKLFRVNLNMNIIHTQELGWSTISNSTESLKAHFFGNQQAQQISNFPYRVKK